jgi:hypothetical protein
MVAICPDGASTAEDAIHRFRQADREPLTTTRDAVAAIAFDEQVKVVSLDTEMNEPESIVRGLGKRAAHGSEDGGASQRWYRGVSTHRHMDRQASVVRHSSAMRDASPSRRWRAAGSRASTTPRYETSAPAAASQLSI